MKNNLFISCIFLSFSTLIFSQNYTISGRVTLENSAISLPGINVLSKQGDFHTITDYDGYFKLEFDQKETVTLLLSGIGFQSIQKTIDLAEDDKITVNFSMREDIIDLPIVEINAHSATGGMMGSMEIPGSSHYISSKEIKEIQSTNPNDILQRIPGVQIQEEDGFGLRPNIGLRASGSERSSKITMLEDGILAAPAPYSAPSAYYFPTIARMSGIEVRKGSSQIVQGPYTTGGIINFLSTPVPSTQKGLLQIGTGSFGSRNVHAHYGDTKGTIGYMLESFQYSATGFKTIDFSDNETGFDKKDFLGKLKWTSPQGSKMYQSFTLKIGETREHSDETYLGLSYQDFLNNPYRRYAGSQMDEMNTRHRQLSIQHLINPAGGFYIQTTAYRNTFSRNWYKLDKIHNQDGSSTGIADLLEETDIYQNAFSLISGRSSNENESLSVKANNRSYTSQGIQSKANFLTGNHSLELGLRWHFDEMDRFQWVDRYIMDNGSMKLSAPGIQGTESNRIEDAHALALYMQYAWENDNFAFQLGLRREAITLARMDYGKDDPERLGANLNQRENVVTAYIPGLSLMYKMNANQQIFAGVHKGFAPPGSSPNTSPENSINYELGYRMEKSNLYFSSVAFFNNYKNLLGSDLASSGGLGSGDQFNGGAVKSYGIEIATNYRTKLTSKIWLPWQIQYTYNKATFSNSFESDFEPWNTVRSGDHLPYLAPHTFTISTGLRCQNWSWNIVGSYMDDMRIKAGQGNLNKDQEIARRFLVSSNIMIGIDKKVNLTLGVHNLLNNRYAVATRPAGWRPGAPRNVTAGLQVRF